MRYKTRNDEIVTIVEEIPLETPLRVIVRLEEFPEEGIYRICELAGLTPIPE